MAMSPALRELIFQRRHRKPGGNRVITEREQGHDSMNGDVSEGSSRGGAAWAWMGREVTSAEGHTCQGQSNQKKCGSGERMCQAEGQRMGYQRLMRLQYKGHGEGGKKQKGPDSEGLVKPRPALAFHSTGREKPLEGLKQGVNLSGCCDYLINYTYMTFTISI